MIAMASKALALKTAWSRRAWIFLACLSEFAAAAAKTAAAAAESLGAAEDPRMVLLWDSFTRSGWLLLRDEDPR